MKLMGSRSKWINRGATCPNCGYQLRPGWVDVVRFWAALKPYYTPGSQGVKGTSRLNGFTLNSADQANIRKLKNAAHKRMHEETAERLLVNADLDLGILNEVLIRD